MNSLRAGDKVRTGAMTGTIRSVGYSSHPDDRCYIALVTFGNCYAYIKAANLQLIPRSNFDLMRLAAIR